MTQGFHWLLVRCGAASLRVCFVLRCLSAPASCVSEHSTAGVTSPTRFRCNYRIMWHHGLWSVDFRPGFTQTDVLFIRLSEIWSGINTEYFILKLARCFNVVSVSNFLSCTICSVLNCCILFYHPAKIEALRICKVDEIDAIKGF